MKTVKQFVKEQGIRISVKDADTNPHMEDSSGMDHWKVTMKRGRRQMTLIFSKGIGHHGAEPEAEEVLNCLASDSASIDNAQGFEDWAEEYGYDTDSRKAEKVYKTCDRQATRLRNFLGDAYEELVWDTERL